LAEDADRADPTEWRQGDFALGVGSFLFGDIPDDSDEGGIGAFFEPKDPAGFVVVSQTCDIVSDTGKLAGAAVCPLIEVDPKRIDEIARGRAPRLGFVEHAPEGLVADLARPMTISKQLLSTWKRVRGFTDQTKALEFARSLERVFGRFAFPDAFNDSIGPLLDKINSKYGKPESPLGKALKLLAELRVRPSASWDASDVCVQFLLVVAPREKRVVEPTAIKEAFEAAVKDLPWQGGFGIDDPPVRIGGYDDFLARDYVESFPLDVNALSFAARYARKGEEG
jgi:hypothetical protein